MALPCLGTFPSFLGWECWRWTLSMWKRYSLCGFKMILVPVVFTVYVCTCLPTFPSFSPQPYVGWCLVAFSLVEWKLSLLLTVGLLLSFFSLLFYLAHVVLFPSTPRCCFLSIFGLTLSSLMFLPMACFVGVVWPVVLMLVWSWWWPFAFIYAISCVLFYIFQINVLHIFSGFVCSHWWFVHVRGKLAFTLDVCLASTALF